MPRSNLGVTDSGVPYDRTDGLPLNLEPSEIRAILRAMITALELSPGGPPPSGEGESEAFEVALAKLSDMLGEDWVLLESWRPE
jgi:hypothetical protein